jgi:PhnB protein
MTTSSTTIQPYLFFDGRCEEALEFYKTSAGAEVKMLMRYKDNPDPQSCQPDASAEKVMHAEFQVGGSSIFASDGRCENKPSFSGFGLSIAVATPAEAEKYFNGLAEGGQPFMPLTKTFFSPSFGMLTDKFGVTWMVMARPEQP